MSATCHMCGDTGVIQKVNTGAQQILGPCPVCTLGLYRRCPLDDLPFADCRAVRAVPRREDTP